MRRIIYTAPDGRVVIEYPQRQPGMTDEESARFVKSRLPAGARNIRYLPDDTVLPDRRFRDAWKPGLTIDMAKAREIQRDRMRTARKPLLAALDIEYQIADEREDIDAKRAIARKKQALRDITADPAIEAATTPDELAAISLP